ncbi:unnamed protein product [Cochlearia groenlandica]
MPERNVQTQTTRNEVDVPIIITRRREYAAAMNQETEQLNNLEVHKNYWHEQRKRGSSDSNTEKRSKTTNSDDSEEEKQMQTCSHESGGKKQIKRKLNETEEEKKKIARKLTRVSKILSGMTGLQGT